MRDARWCDHTSSRLSGIENRNINVVFNSGFFISSVFGQHWACRLLEGD